MAKILFRLRNVPEDEAAEVRHLLDDHGMEYFETSGGLFGIGTAAIWLKDESRLAEAKKLVERYQEERFRNARDEYEQAKAEGRQRRMLDLFLENPLRFLIYLGAAVLLIYMMLVPFLKLSKI